MLTYFTRECQISEAGAWKVEVDVLGSQTLTAYVTTPTVSTDVKQQ